MSAALAALDALRVRLPSECRTSAAVLRRSNFRRGPVLPGRPVVVLVAHQYPIQAAAVLARTSPTWVFIRNLLRVRHVAGQGHRVASAGREKVGFRGWSQPASRCRGARALGGVLADAKRAPGRQARFLLRQSREDYAAATKRANEMIESWCSDRSTRSGSHAGDRGRPDRGRGGAAGC